VLDSYFTLTSKSNLTGRL